MKNEINQVIDKIQIGDIIWIKRYNNDYEKLKIPIGHREGSGIVISKNDDGLICSLGTSVVPENKYIDDYYKLDAQNYNSNKDIYYKLNNLEVVNNSRFIKKIGSLTKEDEHYLLKRIKEIKLNIKEIRKTNNIPISVGEIISFNEKNYIILGFNNDTLICLRLKTNKTNLIVDDLKYLNYLKLSKIKNNERIIYKGMVSSALLKYIAKREIEYQENNKNRLIVQRGSVLLKDGEQNYVYGEEGQKWLTFIISKNCSELSDVISIRNSKYYTEYYTKTIDKKDDFEIISLAFMEEINEIKNLKKTYKHRLEKIKRNRKKYYNSRKK